MKQKIMGLLDNWLGLSGAIPRTEELADEILELFAKYIREEGDKLIPENTPITPFYGGIWFAMERLLHFL